MAKLMRANAIDQIRKWAGRELGQEVSVRSLFAGAVLTLLPLLVACDRASGQPSAQDFDRLCELYRKAAQRDVDSYVRDKQLFAAIEQQLPDIHRHYSYLSEAKGERVHGLIKDLAGQAGNADWDCPIIHQYHTGQLSELAGSDQRN